MIRAPASLFKASLFLFLCYFALMAATAPLPPEPDDQVGSIDEYEITLGEGILDETLLEDGGIKRFEITSYGADYIVDSLVKRMRAGAFKIPPFQRRFVWTQKHASRFIESLLMGLPIPSIFLYKEADTNEHLVIDGQQRLRTLQAFYDGTFGERKFRLQGIRDPWNEKTYEELAVSDQLKIDDSIVHAIVFKQDSPADVLDSIYYVFERINSGGIRLSPQEIRNCISAGKFIELVKRLNLDTNWRLVFGGPENKRAKDEELIIRFVAMWLNGDGYYKPMAKFLNDMSAHYNKFTDKELAEIEHVFRETSSVVAEALNGSAFRPSRALNAAVFDSAMPAIADRLRQGDVSKEELAEAYYKLLLEPEYLRACERATSDEDTVAKRRKLAMQAFAAIPARATGN